MLFDGVDPFELYSNRARRRERKRRSPPPSPRRRRIPTTTESPFVNATNAPSNAGCSLAAKRRWESTRSEKENDENLTKLSRRQIAQRARRLREKAVKEAASAFQTSSPGPPKFTHFDTQPMAHNIGFSAYSSTHRGLHVTDVMARHPWPSFHQAPEAFMEIDSTVHPILPASNPHVESPLGIARRAYTDPLFRHDLGNMDIECTHCGALHWEAERLSKPSKPPFEFGTCCSNGKVQLPLLDDPPRLLRGLFTGSDSLSKEFRQNITQYNAALAFTSVGTTVDKRINSRFGPRDWVFRIQGQMYHLSSALEQSDGHNPTFGQLYVMDPTIALQQRMFNNSNTSQSTMEQLQGMVKEYNPYAAIYEESYEILHRYQAPDVAVRLRVMPGGDKRRYNLPTADEVGVILPGDGSSDSRDILLRCRTAEGEPPLVRISERHAAYAPLHYVLLFPYGESGWHEDLQLQNSNIRTRMSQTVHAAFRLHPRRSEFSSLLRGCRLFQQYAVDMWATADQNRLNYLKENQDQLRLELYNGLTDAIQANEGEVDLFNLGRRFVLPSSYIGGPRHMQQQYQDAMAIARYYRKVDLFITMTANPEWEEITRELEEGQTAYDRPDLVARVFELKKRELLRDIHARGIFGNAVAYVYTIEFQKRGLPHIHLLIFLADGWKLSTVESIDSCISAQWPDPVKEPLLFDTIRKCMVHGPCGNLNKKAPCMENGRCTKHYPRAHQSFTSMDEDGYPLYARPDDGRHYEVRGHLLDNSWIVPYNPYLSSKYNCHINVECAANIRSIKYPFKYIHKGGDRATLQMNVDEITQYIDGRYIGPEEAVWRIFHFDTHAQIPNVVRLAVHLPGQHMVTFNPNEPANSIFERGSEERTTLSEFFKLNSRNDEIGEEARNLLYQEIPQVFRWLDNKKTWSCRKTKHFAIGRMYFVSPRCGEHFYLRLLLTVVRGPRSFEDLRRYEGVTHDSYRDACLARGLLEDDGEWARCLREAAQIQPGSQLRHLFATLLMFCDPSRPEQLWKDFRDYVCDDLEYELKTKRQMRNPTREEIYDYGLYLLESILQHAGDSLSLHSGMPLPKLEWGTEKENPLIAEHHYNPETERELADQYIPSLNKEQRDAFDEVVESVEKCLGRTFFLDGAGGTGKTFVYKTLCHWLRSQSHIVLCVASSGIASLLLPGGRTAHSLFKIPIEDIDDSSICNISKQSLRADLLRAAGLIIWDEALMQNRHTHEALDRTLRDLRSEPIRPFGGLTTVFGGDFRQILPVIPHGSQEEIVNASLRRSYLWSFIDTLKLRINQRLEPGTEEDAFASWLLRVGDGISVDSTDGSIPFPSDMQVPTESDLIDAIYPHISSSLPPPSYFYERIILAARNSDVGGINAEVLSRLPGNERVFYSADSIIYEEGADGGSSNEPIPPEHLRTMNTASLPLGELHLKLGCPLILLRNLDPSQGLCNGTRLLLRNMTDHVLEAEILGGDHDGEIVFIPRITITPSRKSMGYAFLLKRRQFPVRLAFAVSINKAQGQSVQYVGLDLRVPVFTHGQLYVAFSRATSRCRVKVLLSTDSPPFRTKNIVYPEALM